MIRNQQQRSHSDELLPNSSSNVVCHCVRRNSAWRFSALDCFRRNSAWRNPALDYLMLELRLGLCSAELRLAESRLGLSDVTWWNTASVLVQCPWSLIHVILLCIAMLLKRVSHHPSSLRAASAACFAAWRRRSRLSLAC